MTNNPQAEDAVHAGDRRTDDSRVCADGVSRRTMLRGAAVGGLALPLLAACGGGSTPSSAGTAGSAGSSAGGSAAAKPKGSSAAGGVTVAEADVPVGGGTILTDQAVVVTQPTKGRFKAFSAICTHAGCPVNAVSGGEIICPCHGSHFSITDGSPVSGPAPSPLPAKKVEVAGGKISVT